MAKKKVRIYKSPTGKGEYRSKLKNFLYIAEQGMSVPQQGMQQGMQQRGPAPLTRRDILLKEALTDYMYNELGDKPTNDDIKLVMMSLQKQGHNPELIQGALQSVLNIIENAIPASNPFKEDIEDEEIKVEEESNEGDIEEETMINEGVEEDDVFFDDMMNESSVNFIENEEVDTKRYGGIPIKKLGGAVGGPGDEIFEYVAKALSIGGKKLSKSHYDNIVQHAYNKVYKTGKYGEDIKFSDDLLKQEGFLDDVNAYIKKSADDLTADLKPGRLKNRGKSSLKQREIESLLHDTYLGNDKMLDLSQGKLSRMSGTGTGSKPQGLPLDNVYDESTKVNSQSILSTGIEDGGGLVTDAQTDLKVLNVDDSQTLSDQISEGYVKHLEENPPLSQNGTYGGHTADGDVILSVQAKDGNVHHGILTGGEGNYEFKLITGLDGSGKPLYMKDAPLPEGFGNTLVENSFLKGKNNITTVKEFDTEFFIPKENLSEVNIINHEELVNVTNPDDLTSSWLGNVDPKIKMYGTKSSPGAPSWGQSLWGASPHNLAGFNPKLYGSESYLSNRFGVNRIMDKYGDTYGVRTSPTYNPLQKPGWINRNIINPLNPFGNSNLPFDQQGRLGTWTGKNRGITDMTQTVDYHDARINRVGQTPSNFGNENVTQHVQGNNPAFDISPGRKFGRWAGRNFGSYRTAVGGAGLYGLGTSLFSDETGPYNQDMRLRLDPKYTQKPDRFTYKVDGQEVNPIFGDTLTPETKQRTQEMHDIFNYDPNKQLGGMTKAQFVKKGLKSFKKYNQGGNVNDETPSDVNAEIGVREENKNVLLGNIQNNVAEDQETKRLEQEYDMLRNQELNQTAMYDNEGMQYAKWGAQSRDMRKLNRQMRRANRQMNRTFRNAPPTNMTNYKRTGLGKWEAQFDPNIPNMNMGLGAMGMGLGNIGFGIPGLGKMLSNIISNPQVFNRIPTTYRTPLITEANKANIVTNTDKEKAAQNQVDMQQDLMYLEVLKNNPPGENETLEEYKSRVNLGNVQITEEMFNTVKASSVKDLPGTNFPVISGCFGGNCPDPNKQEGGFVDASNPDLYRFVYGGDDMPMAREGIIVEGEEGMQPLPVNVIQNQQNLATSSLAPFGVNQDISQPYGESPSILMDPNIQTPAIQSEEGPTVSFNQETGMFEEVAPVEESMVTVAPGEGVNPALLDTSKELIQTQLDMIPISMREQIPEEILEQNSASAIGDWYKKHTKKGPLQLTTADFNVTPNFSNNRFGSIDGSASASFSGGSEAYPSTFTVNVGGKYVNVSPYPDPETGEIITPDDKDKFDINLALEYTKNTKLGNFTIGTDMRPTFDKDNRFNVKSGDKGGLYVKWNKNLELGGEPELPQARWGLFNTLARGFAANPAFGRRTSYSGPQTMAGQTYYGAPGTLVKQEGRRNPFRTKWTNTYAVPGAPKLYGVGPDGAPTRGGAGTSFLPPEEQDTRSRAERKTDRLLDRRAAKDERQYERRRRRSIRKGLGDFGSYDEMIAASELPDMPNEEALETQRERQNELGEGVDKSSTNGELLQPKDMSISGLEEKIMIGNYGKGMNSGQRPAPVNPISEMPTGPAPTSLGDRGVELDMDKQGSLPNSTWAEGVNPQLFGTKSDDRYYDYSEENLSNKDINEAYTGNDNITFNPSGTGRPTLQNRNPEVKREIPFNANMLQNQSMMSAGADGGIGPMGGSPNPFIQGMGNLESMAYGGWYAQGGPIVEDEVEMTEEEIRAFMQAGGIVEFI